MTNPSVSDSWERGSPYEQYIGRWSRRVAPLFLAWLRIPNQSRWVDVGCGTGALCAAILDTCAPTSVIGVEPSEGFRSVAQQNLGDRAKFLAGTADSIALGSGVCDVAVSGLVFNFIPDLQAGLAEMSRVVVPGGTIAAYVWDYADRMEVIKCFWDVAASLDPAASHLHEGTRFPLCKPEALQAAFVQAGFRRTIVTALDFTAEFADFEEYWRPFLGGQGPAPAYAMSLTPERRSALRNSLKARFSRQPNGVLSMSVRAWAVRASVARGA